MTREQIEEARDAILDSINATEQEFACNKAQHDLLGVRRREFLNALCDMALRAAEPVCPSCGGNDGSRPCAYPSENQPKCLRDKRRAAEPAQPVSDVPPAHVAVTLSYQISHDMDYSRPVLLSVLRAYAVLGGGK